MKKLLLVFTLLSICIHLPAQTNERTLLHGKVVHKNTPVANENVINITSEKATITNDAGEFSILARPGDELAFSAINYKLKTLKLTEEIFQNKNLIIEVDEKITELDEVTVTPEELEKFIELREEAFKKFDYKNDTSTPVVNNALSQSERGMQNGLNFVNVFKALFGLFKSNKEKNANSGNTIKPSSILRQLYEDEFFVVDLKIPQDKIDEFLYYCDDKLPEIALLRKENEFQLIDFLLSQSKAYRKLLE